MKTSDVLMTKRLRDILAVSVEDLDAVSATVEDGVAYLEGVVPSDEQRKSILRLAKRTTGTVRVIACLSTEKVRPRGARRSEALAVPPPVLMHYYSLS
jgi:osmotically-inducible protein OsmY